MDAILSVLGAVILLAGTILETLFVQLRWLLAVVVLLVVVGVIWVLRVRRR